MTVIVGIVTKDKVVLAGDSYCASPHDYMVDLCKAHKVFKVAPTVGLGICGDLRAERLVTDVLKELFKKRKKNLEKYISEGALSYDLHQVLDKVGVMQEDKGVKSLEDSAYLLAHAGKLYYMEGNLTLWESQYPYAAIGAGSKFALGALAYADLSDTGGTSLYNTKTATTIAINAVEATARHCALVATPTTHIII